MFNRTGSSYRYNNRKVLGGSFFGDYSSFKTIYAGPDPADTERILIRKVIQTGDKTWAFEETRVSPSEVEGGKPTVHSQVTRLGILDLNENISDEELAIRLMHRSMPNIISFSLFSRAHARGGANYFQIVENSLFKASYYRWQEFFKDWQDSRAISAYLRYRWWFN